MKLLAGAVALVTAASAAAQSPVSPATRTDSARMARSARSAQARFESRRRFLAPRFSTVSTAPCQIIGRFCRRASGTPFRDIPAEPAGITRARKDLFSILAEASSKIPGDAWVAGQRVRYLVEAGDDLSAAEAARECRADKWWCDALTGLAAHAANRFVAAEQAFARAILEMPPAKRCDWTNLSQLLDGGARDDYKKLGCAARESANRKIWWLADPLFSTPGNERRTEHFARETWAEIERDGANGFGMSWGSDMKEMIARFGWAEKWTQEPPSGIVDGRTSYSAHEREPDFHFLPVLPHTAPLGAFTDSAWAVADGNASEGYSPRYLESFVAVTPQVARFRRGDSTLVVTAFDVSADTAWKRGGVRPALVLARSDTSRFTIARYDSAAARSALWIVAPPGEALVSLELLSLDGKVGGRWRSVFKPLASDSSRRNISDILLFDATDSLPTGIDGAIAAAFGQDTIGRATRVGVYWETYGAAASDTARTVSLTLTPIAPGLITRVLRALGVGKKLTPVDVRWHDEGAGAEAQPKSVALDLSQVARGRYELRLTLGEGPGASSASKVIVLRDRSTLASR